MLMDQRYAVSTSETAEAIADAHSHISKTQELSLMLILNIRYCMSDILHELSLMLILIIRKRRSCR